jgi:hypothetical protein
VNRQVFESKVVAAKNFGFRYLGVRGSETQTQRLPVAVDLAYRFNMVGARVAHGVFSLF